MAQLHKQQLKFGRWDNLNVELLDERFWFLNIHDFNPWLKFFHSSQN